MKFNLYDDNGFINIEAIYSKYDPLLLVIVGGRGIGKTYGVLKYLTKRGEQFMLVRRTTSEREFIRQKEFNPLNALFKDSLIDDFIISSGKYSDSYLYTDLDEKPLEEPFAYCVSISSASKIRGIDARAVKTIYFDEFIKDNNEKGLTDEAGGLFQLMETIGRNRELKGEEPLRLILTANSNNIFNPICDTLKLNDIFYDMRKQNQELRFLKAKRILLVDIKHSPISEKKKATFLYRLTEGTEFYHMAVDNKYYNDVSDYIGCPYPLREFKPFAAVKNIQIMRHSSNRLLYVTAKNRGTPRHRFKSWSDFLKEYNILISKLIRLGAIFFESMELATNFKDFI